MFQTEIKSNRTKAGLIKSDLTAMNGRVQKSFDTLGMIAADLPLSKIGELFENENVEYISPDIPVQTFGHIGNTTGWKNTGIVDDGDDDPNTWLTGNVGSIVVIDSGIDPNHELLRWMNDGGGSKVIYSKDFTGQGITGDPYGHGTPVASLFGGDWVLGNAAYEVPADGAAIISLRVLNS